MAKALRDDFRIYIGLQVQLESFQAAVDLAAKQGIKYDELITIGGWELKFGAPRQAGMLPVVYHARSLQ